MDISTLSGCVYSATQSFTVNPDLNVNISPDSYTICQGGGVLVTVNNPVGAYTYTYIKEGVEIAAATNITTASYTITNLNDGDIIAVEATDNSTGCTGTSSFTVNVISALSSVGSITRADTDILCSGEVPSTIFGDGTSGSASATTTTGTITYQWYYKTAAMANFAITGSDPIRDQSINYSPSALSETTTFKRLASVILNGVSCSDSFSLTEEIVVYDAEGGTLDSTSASMCFSFGDPAPTITVTGSSVGNYQWQDSSDGIVFANVPSAQLTDFTPTITATGTYYYRRVTTVGTCSDTTDVFTLTVGETDAGSLDTAPSGVYCYGTQPPQLGIGTSVNGSSGLNAVTYRWESKIDGAIGGYNEIIGETNRAYQPPPLFASPTEDTTVYLYRRVTLSLGGCESVPSNVVSITISREIEVGYLNFQNVDPDNYFICQGQDVENLVLINATPVQAGVVTYTWQESTDLIVWKEVASSSSNSNLNFGTSNTPSVTTYYRVKITSGEGSPDSGTSVLNILLTETSETPTIGEVYSINIDGYEARVTTTAAVSTTDTLGAALAASITSSVTGYTATYFADENIIEIDNYTTDVTISRSSSSTLFSAPILLSYDSSEDFCSAYTNVVGVTIYEEPLIQQTGGSIDSQVICLNSAIDPVTFNVTGSYDYVVITGISDVFDVTASGSGSATYSTLTGAWTISNTSAFTITGTPTLAANQSLLIQIETSGSCDEEAVFNYRIETVQSPNDPDIIYRNNPQNSRALNNRHQIFQSGGTWFNNTVAQDSDDVLPDNAPLTYEFAACYSNNQDLRYVKFDWQILPVSAVQSITYKNDNDTTMQAIITASYDSSTVTFTAGSDYVITITSPDGSTNDVTFTTVQDDITENLDDLDNDLEGLPSISSSRSGNVITLTADTPGEAGYFSIQVQNPDNAEIFINSPEYLYPEQDNAIEVIFNPDFGTQTPTITSGGVTATLRVRAESIECDDVFSDWYEVELYVVSEQNPVANFPNIREPEVLSRNYCGVDSNDTVPACEVDTESNLESTFYAAAESGEDNDYAYLEWKIDNVAPGDPSAPFPGRYFTYNNGIDPDYGTISWAPGFHGQFDVCVRAVACDGTTDTWECYSYVISPESEMPDVFALNIPVCPITANTVTSTFTSNLMVNWTITPLSAIASTSTRTVNGLDAFDVVWEEGYSGMVWLTADVKDCAGDPRYYTVRIPEDPNLTRTSTPMVQTVCQGDQILPITYSVTGYSVLGINDAELPLGLTGVYSSTVQEATIRVFQRTLSVDDSDNKYILAVDYNDYAYEADGTESLTEITEAITSMVVSSTLVGTATSTTSNNSSTIIITGATPGIRFNIASNTPETSRYTISQPVIANLNGTYTVSGSVSETLTTSSSSYRGVGPSGTSQVHEFDLTIISSSASCTTVTETVVIYYNPKGSIATATPTLLTQYICDGDSLEEIEFELSGGATDYDPVVWYPAEPNGIEFSPESGDVLGVGTSFTLSGTLNTGVTTTTVYYYTITTNGSICDTGSISGTLVVYPKEEILLPPNSPITYDITDFVDLKYTFEGVSSLTLTASSSADLVALGLTPSYSYTTTPSVELTIVSSPTVAQQIYSVELVQEDGSSSRYFYQASSTTESITSITAELANLIDQNANVIAVVSDTDSSVINISANDQDYIFWIRINEGQTAGSVAHYDEATMRITNAVPVQGVFSLTGTPTVSITETTSYTFTIVTPGIQCTTDSETTVVIINPEAQITLTSSLTTLNQELTNTSSIDSVTFLIGGDADSYTIEWPNGAPTGLSISPVSGALAGTNTLTLSGKLDTATTTTTVYYYTITAFDGLEEGGSISGSVVVHPDEIISLSPPGAVSYCNSDLISLSYQFEGFRSLSVSSTSSSTIPNLGIISELTYLTTPTVLITVVASATSLNEDYQIEIVQEDGNSTAFNYQSTTATESISSIANGLAAEINATNSAVVATVTSGGSISIEAVSSSYVFWIRINQGSVAGSMENYEDSRIRVTGAIAVKGEFTVTGTPTISVTATTSYSLIVVSPGLRVGTDSTSATTIITLEPEQLISLTSSSTTLNQVLCDNTAIDDVVFQLSGNATGFTGLNWIGDIPGGILQPALGVSNTITLTGTITTGVTTTTVYVYSITTTGNSCESNTVTGSFTVNPDHYITLDVDSESDQTVCDLSAIDPIEFEISGGATGVSVDWPSGNPGLNIYLSNSSSTTYVISGTLNTSVATETIYTYTVTTIGNSCTEATLSGQITVIPQLIINVDSPLTQSQMGSNALCNGDDIQAIDFSFTSGNSPTLFLDWTDSSGVSIGSPGPALSGYSIRGPITTSSTELTTYYYTLRAVQTNGSCVFTDEFNGTLQVSPDIIVHENYIRVNDVTDVSCPLGNDGSIIIPSTPESEFQLRIEGGQTASAQIDKVALLVSDTLDGGDQISVIIDGITFTSVVASGTTTQTMLEELRDKVNFGTGSDNVAVTAVVINDGSEVYLQLTADTAGSSFVASGTTITSLVTGTTVVSTLVENENLNYEYTWTRDGALVGSTLSIENLIAGTYTLAVSINGCQASSTYSFEIQQPSISVGTISETCNGDISVPISAYLTASQLAIPGTKVTAELYELGSDNTYSELFGTQNFSTSLATNTFAANFYSLAQGEMYQLVVTDNTCSNRITQLVGPLNTFLAITENSITTTDEECFGEGGNLTLPLSAITGGSGYYSYNWTNLSTAEQYNTRNVTGAAAGLYEVTIADQNYGCEVTTVGLIEIEAVTTDISVQWSEPGPITNDCFDSRDGTLEVVVNGGSGDFFYDWYFQPSTSSVTLQLSNDSDQLVIDNAIPASYSAGGEYYVRITDGGGVSGCADSGTLTNFVVVNPEEISFATASSTISNIQCAGEETGSIYVEVAGGTGNYLYTINGGIPYLQTTGVISENNLPAGNYTLIVEDENNNCSSAQQITQAITISEPAGGPLELSLGEINEIPCDGGLGSIEIGISGGSPITTNSASTVIDFYTVTVARQGGGFILNTTHDPSNSSLQIGNLATAGTYDITVSDTNGCTQQLTNIILNNTSNGLGASGVITQASGCNNISSTDGATITVAWPDRGDGNNGGYPLWQQRIAVNLDSFTIVLNGTVAGADLSTLGVAVTTTNANTIFASSTASSSLSTVQDVAAQLAYNINQIADLTATLNGSTILVKGQLIDSATSLSASGTTLNLSVSGVSQIADSQWTNVPGMDGMEVVSGLSAGYYRAIINDGSGCGGTLVQNTSQGGTIFEIDAPQSLQFDSIEFDEVTCTQPTSSLSFKLSNGVYTYSPDPSAFELTLNSVLLTSTVGGSVSFSTGTTTSTTSTATTSSTTAASSVGSTYTPNLRTNSVEIENLIPGDYELVVKNIQTECLAVLNFTINDASSITYSGETDFDIDPCFDTYQEAFFDPFLIDGGEPFSTAAGEPFYSLRWTYTPNDLTQNTATINSVSNNVNFAPRPGTYELLILDSNGCTILDENGDETPIEFTFNQSLTSLEVSPAGGVSGDQFATPVSCEIGAEDGQISIEVDSSDPFEINWHKQESSSNVNEQRLLFQGTAASGVGSEVYSIRINDVPLFYETQVVGEPIASVVPSFAAVIDSSPLFTATVDPADPNEILISSSAGAEIKLEIVSLSTTLQMVNSSTSGASWVPLDGTSGNPNYTGYLSLNNLAEGLYRYTISAVDVTNCNNGSDPNTIQQIIAVENENILEIREGPIVDEYLCNGKSGTLFIDVFDGNTGPLTFFYNSTPVTYEIVGTNQYIINIDNPVETATLEIYNAANCGLSREINIGNGTPLFEFSSTNFEQSQTFLAREDITFIDNSENEYDSFEFIFGDGTQTELIERNSPDPILHEYAISGTYYVTLRIYNDLGCVEELTKTIKIGKGFSVLVPNVFTPNGDIWNSTFRPIFNGLSEITLRVYDAQGGLLYEEAGAEGSDPDTFGLSLRGWEGNTNLSSSPYFIYTITAKTIDDEAVFRDGTFILLQ